MGHGPPLEFWCDSDLYVVLHEIPPAIRKLVTFPDHVNGGGDSSGSGGGGARGSITSPISELPPSWKRCAGVS